MAYICVMFFLRDVGDGLEYDGLKLAPTTQSKSRRGGEAEKVNFLHDPNPASEYGILLM